MKVHFLHFTCKLDPNDFKYYIQPLSYMETAGASKHSADCDLLHQNRRNEGLIADWLDFFNKRDWDAFGSLFHPDFRVIFDDQIMFRWQNFNKITRNFDVLRQAVGIKTEFQLDISEDELGSLDTMLKVSKAEAEYENTTRTILDKVVSPEKVWVKLGQEITEITTKKEIYSERIEQISIRDGKIFSIATFSDFFSALINIGKLILETKEQEVIDGYIESLKEMGILPHKQN